MRARTISLALLAAFAGCVGTPQPNPPALDPTRVAASSGGRDMGADLVGAPGAIDPAEAELRITPLDATSDPIVVAPETDGSFAVAVPTGRVRLQPRLGELRGAIVDLAIDVGASVIEPALPCLDIALERDASAVAVGAANEIDVAVINDCAAAVTIDATMRRTSDFAIVDAPLRVEAASEGAIRVRFAPSAEGEREEILLVDVVGTVAERRWVTLHGVGAR